MKARATITLEHETPEILRVAIAPENKTMPSGTVDTVVEDKKVVTTIEGEMSVGRLMNTIDDVIKTAILADNVDNIDKD